MKFTHFFAVAFFFLLWGCGENSPDASQEPASGPAAGINENSTREVLERHWETFSQNDLEGVMADYAKESVLITPGATYRGLEEIRDNFEKAFAAFPRDRSTFHLDTAVVVNDVAYILWRADTPTFHLTYATDTFIIRNGKIVRQTYAGVAEPVE
jgi:ketosteroid isomerase-like protein